MNIIPDELNPPPFGDDFFERRVLAENLTSIIQNNKKPLIISLNGAWGEGKSYFARNWIDSLKEDQENRIIPIYFNAYENDFSNDAFITIAVSIETALEEFYGDKWLKDVRAEKLKDQGRELAKDLITLTSSTLIETVIGVNVSGFINKRIESAERFGLNKNKALVDRKFDGFFKLKDTIENYKERLKLAINYQGEHKILFIIDELDRCRPDFALQIIEKAKHLFNEDNVHFVLAVNKAQLLSSIIHSYGVDNKHAHIYWQKFITIEASLPSVKNLAVKGDNNKSVTKFILNRIKAHDIPHRMIDPLKMSWLLRFVNGPGRIELVPRSIERLFQFFTVIASSSDDKFMEENWRKIFFFILLRQEVPIIYAEIRQKKNIPSSIFQDTKNIIRSNADIFIPQIIRELVEHYFDVSDFAAEIKQNTIELSNFDQVIEKIELYDLPNYDEKVDKK